MTLYNCNETLKVRQSAHRALMRCSTDKQKKKTARFTDTERETKKKGQINAQCCTIFTAPRPRLEVVYADNNQCPHIILNCNGLVQYTQYRHGLCNIRAQLG